MRPRGRGLYLPISTANRLLSTLLISCGRVFKRSLSNFKYELFLIRILALSVA